VPAQKNLHELLDILSVSAVVAAETMADALMDGAIIEVLTVLVMIALDAIMDLITAEAMTMKAAMMVEALHHLTREQRWISSSFVCL
jgi:hypothetical protein